MKFMTLKQIFIFLLVTISAALAQTYQPKADPAATIVHDDVRFTVLTPRVIRMEWAENKQFEDRGTLVFVNRKLPVPQYQQTTEKGWLTIKTEALELKYQLGSGQFTPKNLKVHFAWGEMEKSWNPGMENPGNLKGTIRTLDGTDGDYSFYEKKKIELEPGLLSRDGWIVIDDSARPTFDDSDWSWVTARTDTPHQDLYFFGYGYDYKAALADFTEIAGRIALPPRYAFGYWFSRWRAFSEKELREVVNTFQDFNIPLDVLVIDMDWHITCRPEFFVDGKRGKDQAGENYGWTGFTWNEDFFSDPEAFLDWTEEKGLKTCLNLHPASGLQPHESQYEAMAKAMGIDPATKKYVPFNITDKTFAQNYFDLVLHPMEKQGIDFWWLDWQQWNTTDIPGVNPTFYLNYVHYTDMERQGKIRPLIYHRWGGLGNHRYQIGFSGDTRISWESLDYQPYFTATASNVGFGYWGNDIGGFYSGKKDSDELFTRWFQFGIFSPIVKTHATGDFSIKRRIWQYPHATFEHLRDLIHFRYALIPYIYSVAHQTYETGISLCRPMYYDYPKDSRAYDLKNQYMFGDDMLVSPVTKQIPEGRLHVDQAVWLPEGQWYEWSSGTLLQGGDTLNRTFTLTEIPLYVKAGSVIPMQPEMRYDGQKKADPLILAIVPGEKGQIRLYEDEGNNNNFKDGKYTYTPIASTCNGTEAQVVISPVEGKYSGMLKKRSYEIRFLRTLPPVSVKINGKKVKYSVEPKPNTWSYDGDELMTVVYTSSLSTNKKKTVDVEFPKADVSLLDGQKGQIARMYAFSKFLTDKRHSWDDANYSRDVIISAAQTGLRITRNPKTAVTELIQFGKDRSKTIEMLNGISVEKKVFEPYCTYFDTISKVEKDKKADAETNHEPVIED